MPWWRYGHLWLVISGPAVVVVAAIATGLIAASHPDPVLPEGDGGAPHASAPADKALLPAEKGRNHAATPLAPASP